ncbi:MAG: helix-turn-helix transcriptional regulator [Clostridia bacterium]|jgi:transcriptional regulator with XRE-family HTH domain|nr:helix-turn-helix transcriptional regulator [Clostridia bacterium]
MSSVKDRLKELREEKGISQDYLAKQTGLSQSSIAYWERGERVPSAQAIIILAKYFEVSTDYLLGVIDKNEV